MALPFGDDLSNEKKIKDLFLYFYNYVFVCGGVIYVSEGGRGGQRLDLPGAEVLGNCKMPDVAAGNPA